MASHVKLMARAVRLTAISRVPNSMCNLQPTGQDRNSLADLDSQMQEQERIINISYALASEASQRSKQVAGKAVGANFQGTLPAAAPSQEVSRHWQVRLCSLSCPTHAGEELPLRSLFDRPETRG